MKYIFKRLTLTGLLKVIVLTMIQAALLAGCGGGAVGKRVLPAKMSGKKASAESAHFSLWQLPSQTRSQMMSYVLSTRGGKVMVIDGGNRGMHLSYGNFSSHWVTESTPGLYPTPIRITWTL